MRADTFLVALTMSGAMYGCSCDSLYGVDSPRPSLAGNDTFEVDPKCPDIAIDDSAVAPVPRVITLTGRRFQTGLGAESVPVAVRIGLCTDPTDDGGGAMGAGGATQRGATMGVDAAGIEGPICSSKLAPLDRLAQEMFELTGMEDRGCRSRSPFRVDCTLDPQGEAAFGIIGRATTDALSLSGFLPVCVTPLEIATQLDPPRLGVHQRLIAAIPRFGSSRVAIAVVQLPGDELPPTVEPDAQCGKLLSCEHLTARARFQAGVVSPDIPTGTARPSDFRQVSVEVTLTAELRTLSPLPGNVRPFLSPESSCEPRGSDAGVRDGGSQSSVLKLRIARGQKDTQVFYLCAPGHVASYEVSPGIEGTTDSPSLSPSQVSLGGLTEGYSVGSDRLIYAKSCGGEQARATSSAINITHPLESTPTGDGISIGSCGAPRAAGPPDGGPRGASDGSAGSRDASPDAPPALDAGTTCKIELASGGTCTLSVAK